MGVTFFSRINSFQKDKVINIRFAKEMTMLLTSSNIGLRRKMVFLDLIPGHCEIFKV